MESRKKILSVVTFLVVMIVCLAGFFACKNNNESNSSLETERSELLICGFDNYEELTSLRWMNSFGAVELTTEHKTEGENAAKISARGVHTESVKPTVIIPTATEWVSRTNYLNVSAILLDVYNDNDTEQEIGFQYLAKSDENSILSREMICRIPANTQQTLRFEVDRDVIAQFINLDDIASLRLTFANQKTWDEPNRIFYVDNMRLETTEEPIDYSVKVRKDGEYESCDKPEYLSVWGNINQKIYSNSTLSFNDDPAYIKGGAGSFKLISNYSDGEEGLAYTRSVGFKLLKTERADFTDYYSLSFWIYNANDSSHKFFFNSGVVVAVLEPNSWTYIELTVDWLTSLGEYEIDEIYPYFCFHVLEDKPYTFYVDEINLNKYASEVKAPGLTVTDNETEQKLDISWVNKGARGFAYRVLVDGEERVSLTDIGMKTSVSVPYGEYTTDALMVEVEVTAKGAEEQLATASYKKYLFDFTSVPENMEVEYGKLYTIGDGENCLPMATADEGEITWTAEEIRTLSWISGSPVGTVLKTYEDTVGVTADNRNVTKITWALTVGGFTRTAETYLFTNNDEAYMPLEERYSDYIENASLTGDLSVSDFEILQGSGKSLHLYSGSAKASGAFTNPVFLGYTRNYFIYYIYNNGTSEILYKGDKSTEFAIPAKSYAIFNPVRWGYEAAVEGWKMVTADGYLNNIAMSATTSDGSVVDVYLGCVKINADAYDLGEIAVTGEEKNDTVTVSWNAVIGVQKYSYRVIIDGQEIVSATELSKDITELTYDYSEHAATMSEIKIEITAYGEGTQTAIGEYKKNNLSFVSVPENMYVKFNTAYTVGGTGEFAIPTATADKGVVTWIAEELRATSWISGSPVGSVLKTYEQGSSVKVYWDSRNITRITWTLTYESYTTTAYTYLFVEDESHIGLEDKYQDYIAEGKSTGDLTLSDFEILPDTGKSLRLYSGDVTANGSFSNPVFTGYNTNYFVYYIYNAGYGEVTFKDSHSSTFTIPARSYAIFNPMRWGYDAAVLGWKLITEDGTLGEMTFVASTSDGTLVDVYIGCVKVNADAFDFGTFTVNGNEANNMATVSWTAKAGATKYSYRVLINDSEVIAPVELSTDVVSISFDYSAYVDSEICIEVTAYGQGTDRAISEYKITLYSGTY